MLFLRALAAFVTLPGLAAILLPPLIGAIDPWSFGSWPSGAVVMAVGMLLLLWCARDFYASGKGTLAPWDPPRHLVVVGLYRYMRNPMYVSVLVLVAGWALYLGSPVVACYAVILAATFHIRVVTGEEPWLEQQFGAQWHAYARAVGRWLPGCTPWQGDT